MNSETFDFVIVGAGAAGCVCAEKLSRKYSCLLLEAGGDDDDPVVQAHDHWWRCYCEEDRRWDYVTAPQRHLPRDRRLEPKMGRLLGGSTSHNAMFYVRGNLEDYDRWERYWGCDGWNSERFLRAYIALERASGGEDRFHGRRGHLQVRRAEGNEVFGAFAEACRARGIPYTEDSNSDRQLGFSLLWANVTEDWQRHSAYRAFVHPHLSRGNLSVRTRSTVHRVLFDEHGASVGVRYENSNGEPCSVRARKDVILSAGAIGSPQLLMLSGIGEQTHLEAVGLESRVDLPGVGRHLQDHMFAPAYLPCSKPLPVTLEWATWQLFGRNDGNWESGRPDFQLAFCARDQYLPGFPKPEGCEDSDPVMLAVVVDLHPRSNGTVRLASSDPRQLPIIDPDYLDGGEEMTTWRRGFSLLEQLASSNPVDQWVARVLEPLGSGGDAVEHYVKEAGGSLWHPVATCRMGGDSDRWSVVDHRCRVRGVASGLRVIDASVIPELPSGNTQAMTMALAEIASCLVLDDYDR